MNKILKLGSLLLICLCGAAMAQSTPPPVGPHGADDMNGAGPAHVDFATRKSRILAHLDARAAAMTAVRSCVAAAANRNDLKACHEQERTAMESMHPKH